MARKWSNVNLPGALHYVTGNFLNRIPVFTVPQFCIAFLDELKELNQKWPSKLITYVLMPDHFHLIANPLVVAGRCREAFKVDKRLGLARLIRGEDDNLKVSGDRVPFLTVGYKKLSRTIADLGGDRVPS